MTITSRFAGTCVACGCAFPQGAQIDWTKGVGARHPSNLECADAKKARAQAESQGPLIDLGPIKQFLVAAKERGLKAPKLRVLDIGGKTELRLSLTTQGKEPGSISLVSEGVGFLGCIRPNGATTGPFAQDRTRQELLMRVAEDPAAAAKAYAVLMCRCSFCGLPLTDAGSVEVGYGPVCAKHWGLPHRPKGTPDVQLVDGVIEEPVQESFTSFMQRSRR